MTRYVHVTRTITTAYRVPTDYYPGMDEAQIREFESNAHNDGTVDFADLVLANVTAVGTHIWFDDREDNE